MSKGMCTKCNLRSTCTKLCEEAEEYTSQDEIKYDDILLINVDNLINEDIFWNMIEKEEEVLEDILRYSNKWLIYRFYYLDFKSSEYISKQINYSSRHIRRIINDFKDIQNVTDKQYEILKLHFIDRISIKDIVNKLNGNEAYIRTTIIKYLFSKIKI